MYFQSFVRLDAVGKFQDLPFVFVYIFDMLFADFKLEC